MITEQDKVTIEAGVSALGMALECLGGNLQGWRVDLPNGNHVIMTCGEGYAYDDPACDGWSICEHDEATGEEIGGACSMTFADACDSVRHYQTQARPKAQQLVARIKRSSKYYGKTAPNQWFDIRVTQGDSYCIRGNANQYRLQDVAIGVRLPDGSVVDLSR